jgi:hypothetical protein
MATRHSDIKAIFSCPGAWTLKALGREERPASFFHLGNCVHAGIAASIIEDLSLEDSITHVGNQVEQAIERVRGQTPLETKTRGIDSMHSDAMMLIENWYRAVHPSSPDRLAEYQDLDWPPKVEIPYLRSAESAGTQYDLYGTIDAIFEDRDGALVVVDWKSGTRRQKDSRQLDTYRFGIEAPEARAWYHNLSLARPIQMADPYPGDRVVRSRVLAVEAINEATIRDRRTSFKPGPLCRFCPMAAHCPVRGDRATRAVNLEQLRIGLRDMVAG